MRSKILAVACSTLLALNLAYAQTDQAADEAESSQPVTISLEKLAAEADLIALAQVKDTDYEYTRDFPSGGSAYLRILIPYKVPNPMDMIQLYEEGLHESECYFQNPTVFEEGRRYMVFLKQDPAKADRFRGLSSGCAIEVLVTDSNYYAVRYPVTGFELSDDLSEFISQYEFADSYALVETDELPPDQRDMLLEDGYLADHEDMLTYTSGIDLSVFRKLLGPAAVMEDRHARNIPQTPESD